MSENERLQNKFTLTVWNQERESGFELSFVPLAKLDNNWNVSKYPWNSNNWNLLTGQELILTFKDGQNYRQKMAIYRPKSKKK